jgi:hypothetical protein
MIEQEQVYAGRLQGECKPSGYGEYDNLTGYLTGSYSLEWTDERGTRYRTVCQVINLGRPDRGILVDPDKELEHEPFDEAENNKAAMSKMKVMKAGRDAVLLMRMEEVLRQHGPMSANVCSFKLQVTRARVAQLFEANPQLFRSLGRIDKAWGLVGVEYDAQERKVVHKTTMAARQFLIEHGPATAPEIARHLNKKGNYFTHTLKGYPELFYVVGIRPRCGLARPSPIWGVVGVHDET